MTTKRTVLNAEGEELVVQGTLVIEGNLVQKYTTINTVVEQNEFEGDVLIVNSDGFDNSGNATNATVSLRSGDEYANLTYYSGNSTLVIDQLLQANIAGNVAGTIDTANSLSAPVTITLGGDATGSNTFVNGGDTTTIPLTLSSTAVTPGVYGSADSIPVITVDAKGRITNAANTIIAISSSNVNDFNVSINAFLTGATGITYSNGNISITNTGVSASNYGAADTVPTFTVNAQGQLTSAGNTAISILSSQISDFSSNALSLISVTDAGGDGSLTYASGNGVITYTGPNQTEANARIAAAPTQVRAHITGGDGIDFSAGSIDVDTTVVRTSGVQTINGSKTFGDDITISKINPTLVLSDTDALDSTSPSIQFDTAGNQGLSIVYTEFDADLPEAGYGLVIDASPNNAQHPGLGAIQFLTLGSMYADENNIANINVTNSRVLTYGNSLVVMTDRPATLSNVYTFDGTVDLSNASVPGFTITGNLDVTGNLNSSTQTDLFVEDVNITLNVGAVSSANSMIIINRPSGGDSDSYLKWDESGDAWRFTNDGTTEYLLPTSTTDLIEGTNLYHTVLRSRENLVAVNNGGDGSLTYNSGNGVFTYTGVTSTETRAHFSGGYGITYTSGTGDIAIDTSETVDMSNAQTIGGEKTFTSNILVSTATSDAKIEFENSTIPRNNYIGLGNQSDELVIAADEDNLGASSHVRIRVDAANVAQFNAGGNLLIGKELHLSGYSANPGVLSTTTLTAERKYSFPDITGNVILDQGTQSIDGAKTFLGSIVVPTTADTANGSIYSDNANSAMYAYIGGEAKLITPAADVGEVETPGDAAGGILVYAGSRLDGGTVYHGIKQIDNGTYTSISEASNVITIDGNITAIRSAFSANDNGGDGSLVYAGGSGTFTYTGPSQTEANARITAAPDQVRAHISASGLVAFSNTTGIITTTADNYSSWDLKTESVTPATVASGNEIQIVGGTNISVTNIGNVITVANDNAADIESVTAGDGLTGGGNSGNLTLNVVGAFGIIANAGDIEVDTTEIVELANAQTISGAKTFTGGISLGSLEGATAIDLSNHIALWGTTYGISITAGTLNFVSSGVNTLSSTSTVITSRVGHTFSAGLTLGGHAMTDIQIASEATLNDTSLMTANAINNLILDKNYSTTTGTVTSVTAGAGMTQTGTSTINPTLNVIGGTGITASADSISTDDANIVHDNLSGFVANEHIDHSGVTFTAGTGMTGGGTIAGSRTFDVIGGDGITANANDITVDSTVIRTTGAQSMTGQKTFTTGLTLGGHDMTDIQIASEAVLNDTSLMTPNAINNLILDKGYVSSSTGMTFQLEDGAGTELTIQNLTEVKFVEGAGIDITWTDVSDGTDADPYDMTFTVDHDAATNFVANEHIDHSGVTMTAGTGMTGGGTLEATRTLNVIGGDGITANADDIEVDSTVIRTTGAQSMTGQKTFTTGLTLGGHDMTDIQIASESVLNDTSLMTPNAINNLILDKNYSTTVGTVTSVLGGAGLTGSITTSGSLAVGSGTGITVAADSISTDDANIVHDNLSGFVANEHIDHSGVTMTAGTGMTGGGTIAATRTLNVIGGDGITANADDIQVDSTVIRTTGAQSMTGQKTFTTGLTLGGHAMTDIQIASEAVLNDTSLMTPNAINNLILDKGYSTGAGTVTAVTGGTGVTSSGGSTPAISLDFSELTDMTANIAATTEFIIQDGVVESRKTANEIQLSFFNNDAGWAPGTSNTVGTVTSVTAGAGMTQTGTSTINPTLNVIGSTGITVAADSISTDDANIVHDNLSGFVADEHIAHAGVTMTAGTGLTGGGTIAATRTFNVVGGDGITANADDIEVDSTVIRTTGAQSMTGQKTFTTGLTLGGHAMTDIQIASEATLNDTSLMTPNAINNLILDKGYSTTVGTVTSVTAGTGISGGGSAAVSIALDFGELTVGGTLLATDYLVAENGGVENRQLISSIPLGIFNNDQAWSNTVGTVTSITGGAGLTGSVTSSGSLDVGAGTGITVAADSISTNDSQIVHDNLSGFVANEHIDHTSVTMTAGTGMTGGGTIAATRTLNVIGGDGITANADDIQVDSTVIRTTGDQTIAGVKSFTSNIDAQANITVAGDVDIIGNLTAASKSFVIDHPTKPGHKLHYGSLEGPEHGVYVRGQIPPNGIIKLPEYWKDLVDESTVTVQVTGKGRFQNLYVKGSSVTEVTVCNRSILGSLFNHMSGYYFIQAERKDIPSLTVEYSTKKV